MAAAEGGGADGLAAGGDGAPCGNLLPARAWYSEPCIMGIDEAGRGPVLGPMVYGCSIAPQSYSQELAKKGYADSKALSEERREALFGALRADVALAYAVDVLSAEHISRAMLARSRTSLNELAFESTCRLIQGALDAGVGLTTVFVDTVGVAERYAQRLGNAFPGLQFTVCPKADALYPVVSAASIAAKVTRDRAMVSLARQLSRSERGPEEAVAPEGPSVPSASPPAVKLGTGYPADPDTQAWLAGNVDPVFGFSAPGIVRFSWETVTRLLDERGAAAVEWESDQPADMANQGTLNFQPARAPDSGAPLPPSSGLGRHSYFKLRRLEHCAAF